MRRRHGARAQSGQRLSRLRGAIIDDEVHTRPAKISRHRRAHQSKSGKSNLHAALGTGSDGAIPAADRPMIGAFPPKLLAD